MKLDDFLDLLDSPYARYAYEEERNYRMETDEDVQRVLDLLPDYATPQEMFDYLETLSDDDNIHFESIRIVQVLLAAADLDVNPFWKDWYHVCARNALRYGSYNESPQRVTMPKAADYASILELYPSGPGRTFHNYPCLAALATDRKLLSKSELFYLLPRATWLLAIPGIPGQTNDQKGIVPSLEEIYKCKEHPDLLFLQWTDGISMVYQDDFLNCVTDNGKNAVVRNGWNYTRESIQHMMDGETPQDDFEYWEGIQK